MTPNKSVQTLWIVTLGSSDVQLESKATTKQKRKDQALQQPQRKFIEGVWGYWYNDDLRWDIGNNCPFEPSLSVIDETYQLPPRILGMVYQNSDQDIQDEIWSYLTFPLLDNCVAELHTPAADAPPQSSLTKPLPDAIALILTDQSHLFPTSQDRGIKSPYWRDTCALKPILERYFNAHFPEVWLDWIVLEPTNEAQSLDNWNSVLDLTREQLEAIRVHSPSLEANDPVTDHATALETVYVSHQAGTPAISSAVQFCSLAAYGDRVQFLVTSEQSPEKTDIIASPAYLKGIRKQEALALLERYDYAGTHLLLEKYLDSNHQQTKGLLDAAIQWNFANFTVGGSIIKKGKKSKTTSFIQILEEHPNFNQQVEEIIKADKWWWTAYEAAYLGFVRLEQGNTVEAMFHSFRAVEGLLRAWVDQYYAEEIKQTKHPRHQEDTRCDRNLHAYGEDLYTFLTLKKTVDQTQNFDIWLFGNQIFDMRNKLFHQIKGLNAQDDVFEAWRSPHEKQWKDTPEEQWKLRVLNCLNFVSGQSFETLEEASLMARVHGELEGAIANL